MIHYLKTKVEHFQKVWDGKKNFEMRKDDRHFAEGDILILGEGVVPTQCERAIIARVDSVTTAGQCESLTSDHVGLGITVQSKINMVGLSVYDHREVMIHAPLGKSREIFIDLGHLPPEPMSAKSIAHGGTGGSK